MGIGVVSTIELDASSTGTERLELEVPGKVQHPTNLVVQASGRLSSTTQDTKNSGNILRTQWSKQAGDSRQLLGVPRTNETPYELGGPRKREKSRQLLGVPRNASIVLPFDKLCDLRSSRELNRSSYLRTGVIFKVDRLGLTSSGYPSGNNFENIQKPTRSSE